VNKSFAEGNVPNLLKIAKVCPIYKAGEATKISNYRPISVLPSFSKIFEKLVYNRLISYLTKFSILYEHQYGFRSSMSTSLAILEMVERITDAIDSNKFSVGIFIDLSKAFDTINHKILLNKLEFYGIRGTALSWFTSYLSNRQQYVLFNGTASPRLPVTCGVPQGSILGPILFLLYINDIVKVSPLLHFILFADDTNIFMSHRDLPTLIRTLNVELKLLSTWFIANKLSLNVDKTHFIIFRGTRKRCSSDAVLLDKLIIEDKPINQVKNAKFLGVFIDEHLTWDVHIDNLKLKVSKTCGIINKVKHKLPRSILLLIYNSLLLPYLQYCAMIWVCNVSNQSKLSSLLAIQKRAIRNICLLNYRDHTAPFFNKLNLLQVKDIGLLQVSQFMYKANHLLLPNHFCNLFVRNSAVHRHNTRQSDKFHMVAAKSAKKLNTIKHFGPRHWNNLPHDIKLASTLSLFTKKIKSHLISAYV